PFGGVAGDSRRGDNENPERLMFSDLLGPFARRASSYGVSRPESERTPEIVTPATAPPQPIRFMAMANSGAASPEARGGKRLLRRGSQIAQGDQQFGAPPVLLFGLGVSESGALKREAEPSKR